MIYGIHLDAIAGIVITSATEKDHLEYQSGSWVNTANLTIASGAKIIGAGDLRLYASALGQLDLNDDGTTDMGTGALTVTTGQFYSGTTNYTFDTTETGVIFTFVGSVSNGTFGWYGDTGENKFVFSNKVLLEDDVELRFFDDTNIIKSTASNLLQIQTALANFNDAVTVDGTGTFGTGGNTVVCNAGAITASGDITTTAGLLTVNQAADSAGMIIYGYDDEVTSTLSFHIGSDGSGQFVASNGFKAMGNDYAQLWSDNGYITIHSGGTGANIYLQCGGFFTFRDRDASYVTRATIDSATGDITTVGDVAGVNGDFSGTLGVTGVTTLSDDLVFETAGSGLQYGSCLGNEIAWSQAMTQNVTYVVSDASMADGNLNVITHDGNGKLTAPNAGEYLVTYALTASHSVTAKHILWGLAINGTMNDAGRMHRETVATGKEYQITGTAILTLTATQYVQVCCLDADDATPGTATVDHLNITMMQVGG